MRPKILSIFSCQLENWRNFIPRDNNPSFPYRIGLYQQNSVMSGERILVYLFYYIELTLLVRPSQALANLVLLCFRVSNRMLGEQQKIAHALL